MKVFVLGIGGCRNEIFVTVGFWGVDSLTMRGAHGWRRWVGWEQSQRLTWLRAAASFLDNGQGLFCRISLWLRMAAALLGVRVVRLMDFGTRVVDKVGEDFE